MKKITLFVLFSLFLFVNSLFGQTRYNVRIYPKNDTLCYNAELTIYIAGQSFVPVCYQWSNGSTTSTTNITTSGSYTLTVTGYLGSSNNLATITRTKNVVVLDRPKINPLTDLTVCKFDTVKLKADQGYTDYTWNDGSTNINYSRVMNLTGLGIPVLDTASVWYTASINDVCTSNSDTVVVRGVRRPNGVGMFYEGRTDLTINDSVPAGLVLTYVYAPQYEMEFTKQNDPNYIVTYVTPTTTRMAPLNILEAGYDYYVRTRPIINGTTYCWGSYSNIGILPINQVKTNDMSRNNSQKQFDFYSMNGKLLMTKKSDLFDYEWLEVYSNQILIMVVSNDQGKIYQKILNLK